MGRRLTAQEFEEWRVFFTVEELHPVDTRRRHWQLVASARNGAMPRRDRKLWVVTDFMAPDVWAPPKPKRAPPTAQELKAQVAALNSSRRKK